MAPGARPRQRKGWSTARRSRVFRMLCLLVGLMVLPAHAEKLSFAAVRSVPPYVIAESDAGIVVDIVRESLALTEHELGDIQYVSNLRAQRSLAEGRVDMAMHIPADEHGVHHSDPLVQYWNVAITLQDKEQHIRSLEDLSGKRILAFQNASVMLGAQFRDAISLTASYSEQPNQRSQVVGLFRGGADALVMDLHVFVYHRMLLEEEWELDFMRPIRIHSILPPSPRTIAFRSASVRDDFNVALRSIQQNGTYTRILERYDFWGR